MKFFILIITALIFVVSCSSTRRTSKRVTPAKQQYEQTIITPPKGAGANAGASKNPEAELTEAQSFLANSRFDLAEKKYSTIIQTFPNSNYAAQAQIGLKEVEVKKNIASNNLVAAIVLIAKNDLKNDFSFAKDTILNRLEEKELKQILDEDDALIFHEIVYYRLGESSLQSNDLSAAKSYFNDLIKSYPTSTYVPLVKSNIEQIETYSRVSPQTIGVILPLTGKLSSIGQKTLRAISMGFGLNSSVPSKFKIAVIDSEGKPDLARIAVDRLVKEDNVIGIIGTVSSRTAFAAAERANELGVPSIALSQKAGITEAGKYVYRNALTSEIQIQYLVKTAMEKMNLKKFAILYPNDSYGVEFANLFWNEVLSRGGQITGAQVYSPKETDFRDPIKRLVGTYYYDARQDEISYYLDLKKKNTKSSSARAEDKDELLPPIVDFDAIFIPDSPKAIGQIAHMLLYNNVKGVKLLGTNIWNHSSLPKRLSDYESPVLFVDSFNFSDLSSTQSPFIQDYRSIFSEDPGLVEIQAYDTAMMLQRLISQSGASTREDLNEALNKLKNKTNDREFYRPIQAFTIEKQSIAPLKE